jgi:hypothetical protein
MSRCQEGCEAADFDEFVWVEALKIFVAEFSFMQQSAKDLDQDGVAIVELTVDLFAAVRKERFQFPNVGDAVDGGGLLLGFGNDRFEFLVKRTVKGAARD